MASYFLYLYFLVISPRGIGLLCLLLFSSIHFLGRPWDHQCRLPPLPATSDLFGHAHLFLLPLPFPPSPPYSNAAQSRAAAAIHPAVSWPRARSRTGGWRGQQYPDLPTSAHATSECRKPLHFDPAGSAEGAKAQRRRCD